MLDDYQSAANSFINRPEYHEEMDYFLNSALGLTGESGEFADIVKKARFHGIPLIEEHRLKLKKELGDILWYIAQACIPLNTTLAEVATINIQKLADRHKGAKFNVEAAAKKDESKEATCNKICATEREYETAKCVLLRGHPGSCYAR